MKARLDRKTKILTAAVLCACTTLWASPVWAASGGSATNGAYYGGRNTSASGKVEGKTVTIVDGDNYKGVYGGYAFGNDDFGFTTLPLLTGSAEANNNKVNINGGTVTGEQIMGDSRDRIYGSIVGGWSNYASGNEVIIQDVTFEVGSQPQTSVLPSGIYGALVMVKDNMDKNDPKKYTDKIYDNHVYIGSGTITGMNIAGAYVNTDRTHGNRNIIRDNSVTIENVTVNSTEATNGNIYGAWADDQYAKLSDNKVYIKDGADITTGSSKSEEGMGVFGAFGMTNYTSADNNLVEISGGTITGDVYGAYAETMRYDKENHGTVTNNIVRITGGTILGNVYAGVSGEGTGQKNNSIEISGNKADLSQTNLYGWETNEDPDNEGIKLNATNFTGVTKTIIDFNEVNINSSNLKNSLINNVDVINIKNNNLNTVSLGSVNPDKNDININDYSNDKDLTYDGTRTVLNTDSKINADILKHLKELNVDMTAINWEKDTAVIDVSGTADFTGTAISATGTLAAAAGTEVQNGDAMSFIKAGTLTGAKAEDINIDNLQIGFATEAQVEVQDGNNRIDFVVTGAKQATEQVSIIGESRTAAIAFVNQGSDILNNAFGLMDDGKYGIKTFAAAHGNYSKYETGSHIRVNGWSMLAGVGSSEKVNDGTFSWGVFFENGSGNYRTYNDYNGFNLEGFGSAVYNGGGALARYRSNAGNYAEVGVRAGMLKNSLSNAVADGFGVQGGYDEDTSYYGAHVGAGHIFTLDDHSSLDVYGKYFYTHHDSDEFEILGDEVRFDSADSSRLRLGMRYNQNDGNAFSHYYGLAWDYEFNGDADVTAAGFDTGNPSLKGSTAVIEAGIHYAPDKSPWSVDLGLQGYGGQRDGFSGTMQVNYSFN